MSSQVAKYALIVVGAVSTGVVLFLGSFLVFDIVWMKFVVQDPKNTSLGDGIMVVGEGLILGTSLAIVGIGYFLYRFWPRGDCKHSK